MRILLLLLLVALGTAACTEKVDVAVEDAPDKVVQTPVKPTPDLPSYNKLNDELSDELDKATQIADAPANRLPDFFKQKKEAPVFSLNVQPILEPEHLSEAPEIDGASVNFELKLE